MDLNDIMPLLGLVLMVISLVLQIYDYYISSVFLSVSGCVMYLLARNVTTFNIIFSIILLDSVLNLCCYCKRLKEKCSQ